MKNVYNHTFTLGLAPGSKTMPLEAAIEFWGVLLKAPSFDWRTGRTPWLDMWIEYQTEKKTKAVNKDLWKQTLNFAYETVKDDSLGFWNEVGIPVCWRRPPPKMHEVSSTLR